MGAGPNGPAPLFNDTWICLAFGSLTGARPPALEGGHEVRHLDGGHGGIEAPSRQRPAMLLTQRFRLESGFVPGLLHPQQPLLTNGKRCPIIVRVQSLCDRLGNTTNDLTPISSLPCRDQLSGVLPRPNKPSGPGAVNRCSYGRKGVCPVSDSGWPATRRPVASLQYPRRPH